MSYDTASLSCLRPSVRSFMLATLLFFFFPRISTTPLCSWIHSSTFLLLHQWFLTFFKSRTPLRRKVRSLHHPLEQAYIIEKLIISPGPPKMTSRTSMVRSSGDTTALVKKHCLILTPIIVLSMLLRTT